MLLLLDEKFCHLISEHPWMDRMDRNLLTTFFFFFFHALFQWVSYSVLIHIIFFVSCELRIGMYWEFSVCRNLLCVNFFVKFVAPKSKHQSVLLTRFMSLLGSFFFWGQNESLSLLTHFGVCLAQWIMPSSLNFNYSEL